MSHFTVLVIGNDVEKQLQPYHEYECTGIEDEYVFDVNKNDEVDEFLNREVFVGNSKETGNLDYHYYEDPANETLVDPKKMTKLDYFKLEGKSDEEIEEEVTDYHGFHKDNEGNWIQKTNPNAKWDWWVVGGRWSGFFKMKEGKDGKLGKQSLFDSSTPDEDTADVAYKGDIDFDFMRNEAEVKAIKEIDLVLKAIEGTPEPEPWDSVVERFKGRDEARDFYNNQERIVAFKKMTKENEELFSWFADYENYIGTREEYIKRERNRAITTYAYVIDSKWYGKGDMGWWGMSNDNVSQDDWNEHFNKMIDSLPNDTVLTLVDCHI
jgi:hypothetical protein